MNRSKIYEEYILREYDIVPRTIVPVSPKDLWQVTSAYGSFILKRSNASKEQLKFVAEHLDILARKGFTSVVPFVWTKFGEPFVASDSGNYYLVRWIDGIKAPASIEDDHSFWHEKALNKMGEMHYFTLRFWPNHHQFYKWNTITADKLNERWQKRLQLIEVYEQKVKEKNFPSPFDTAFLANCKYILEMGHLAVEYLHEWIKKVDRQQRLRNVFCHGRLHRENILFDRQGNLIFVDFDHANLDTPVRDLSLFFRRHMGTYEWNKDIGDYWMDNYQQTFPLTDEERMLMAVYLFYPERLIKLVQQYDKKEKALSELSSVRQLEKHLNQMLLMRQYTYHFLRRYC